MAKQLYIDKEALELWFRKITDSGRQVYAPVKENQLVDFRRVTSYTAIASDYIQSRQSVKKAVFPKAEILFSYHRTEGQTILENGLQDSFPETVLWQIHPCDAAGFAPLTGIFNWDYKDGFYNRRLEKTTLVSFSCRQSDAYCFCTSVNGGPGNTDGSDILITRLADGGALAEVLTPKGETLTALYPEGFRPASGINKPDNLAQVPTRFTAEQIREKLTTAFDSPVWKQQSERCLGCGACAFVCPTCACFDIQEEAKGSQGRRIRCWDSCGFSLFTQHTSGHNPRPTQSTRWRQRILHKFSYMPERIEATGCTGCGRCSRACPVDMNILEHLTSIAHQNHE